LKRFKACALVYEVLEGLKDTHNSCLLKPCSDRRVE
jgi:hypothetical protein